MKLSRRGLLASIFAAALSPVLPRAAKAEAPEMTPQNAVLWLDFAKTDYWQNGRRVSGLRAIDGWSYTRGAGTSANMRIVPGAGLYIGNPNLLD